MYKYLTQSPNFAQSGPKGGRLLRLLREGFSVPPLVCVSADVFAEFIKKIPEYAYFSNEEHSATPEESPTADQPPQPKTTTPTSRLLRKFRAAARVVMTSWHFQKNHMFVRSATGLVSNAMASKGAKDHLSTFAEAVRKRILALDLGEDFHHDIESFLASVASVASSVAVRSSCVGLEDSNSRAFAGQFKSILNCKDVDTILAAVKTVWASLWEGRLLSFMSMGKSVEEVRCALGKARMSVVLQCQISSSQSGICFSANPSGDSPEEVLVESVFGQGEGIVSGEVEPDRFIIKCPAGAEKKIVSSEVCVKESHLALSSDPAGGLKKVAGSGKAEATLTTDQIFHVCDIAKRLEKFYENQPQDIEFAFDEKGRFFLLQTRPITATMSAKRGESDILEPDVQPQGLGVECPFSVDDYEKAIPSPNYTYNLDHVHVTSALSKVISVISMEHLNKGFRDAAKVYGSPVVNQILNVNGYVFGYLSRVEMTEELKLTARRVFEDKNYLKELQEWNLLKGQLAEAHLKLQIRAESMATANDKKALCQLVSDCWKHAEECMYIHGRYGWAHRIVMGDLLASYQEKVPSLDVLNLISRLVVGTPNCRFPVLTKLVTAFTENHFAREFLVAFELQAASSSHASSEPAIDGSVPKDGAFYDAEELFNSLVSLSFYDETKVVKCCAAIQSSRKKVMEKAHDPQKDPSKHLVREAVQMFRAWHGYVICGSTDIRCATYNECPSILVGILQDIVRRFCCGADVLSPSDLSMECVEAEFKLLCNRLPANEQTHFKQTFYDALQCSVLKNERVLYTDAWSNGILRSCYLQAADMLVPAGYLRHRGHVFELSAEDLLRYLALLPAKAAAEHAAEAVRREQIVGSLSLDLLLFPSD